MAVTGQGFGSFVHNPIINKRPVNPFDKCTIVSAYPKKVVEIKSTMFPSRFVIEAAPEGDVSLLLVEPSSWWKEMDEGQPYLEIQTGSIIVADSIIKDFCNGLLACNMTDKMPALFSIPGEWNKSNIAKASVDGKAYPLLLSEAIAKQRNWYQELVRISDIMWARSNQNPITISDDARIAAEKLGLSKSWMQDFKTFEMTNCVACGELINPAYPVCKHCKNVINKDLAKKLDLKFAV